MKLVPSFKRCTWSRFELDAISLVVFISMYLTRTTSMYITYSYIFRILCKAKKYTRTIIKRFTVDKWI